MGRLTRAITLLLAVNAAVRGQGSPVREYIYFGNRQVAVEARANEGPNDLNYIAPAPNQRMAVTMAFEISDPDGGINTQQLNVIFGWNFTNMRTCYFHWVKQTDTLYLNNGKYGAAEEWKPLPLDVNSTVTSVESDNCRVHKSGTGVTVTGNTRKLTVSLDVLAPMGGALGIWVWGRDDALLDIGWEYMGTYTPSNAGAPSAITMLNPGQPAGSTVQMQFQVTDPDGGGNVRQVNVLVNSSITGVGGCHFVLERLTNTIWLLNGKAPPLEDWVGYLSLDPGSPALIASDFCALTLAGSGHSAVAGDSSKLAVTLNVQFKPPMAGAGKNVYALAIDMADTYIWFQNLATWTIP
jgi:hypothetical protein